MTAPATHVAGRGRRFVPPALALSFALLALHAPRTAVRAQGALPRVELTNTVAIQLPGEVDSNSPAVWELVAGRSVLHVMTSVNGRPNLTSGSSLTRLGTAIPIDALDPWPGGGVWMEAILPDVDGTWYGYVHNEIPSSCAGDARVVPRIGAARSRDRGASWEWLGTVLDAPRFSQDCRSSNQYFVGGVGDFSVALDRESRDVYIFFSEYLRMPQQQGVGVARMAWADRDDPVGKLMVWRSRAWVPASRAITAATGEVSLAYQIGLPVFAAAEPWHDDDAVVDAFWGPSVHWNTHLQQYVMLLSRARNERFDQEGVYVSFAPRLDDPRLWSAPVKILNGGSWYPQVIGLEAGSGTDRQAGETARLFVGGVSNRLIRFVQ